MNVLSAPSVFSQLTAAKCIRSSDILHTNDGFFVVYKSISDILAEKEIRDFPDSSGQILLCDHFFDDWFLYAIPNAEEYTYSLC